MEENKEFTYELKESIATLSTTGSRSCEVNIISFAGAAPKVDIRRWITKGGEKRMGKGICLTDEEVALLRDTLNSMGDLV